MTGTTDLGLLENADKVDRVELTDHSINGVT